MFAIRQSVWIPRLCSLTSMMWWSTLEGRFVVIPRIWQVSFLRGLILWYSVPMAYMKTCDSQDTVEEVFPLLSRRALPRGWYFQNSKCQYLSLCSLEVTVPRLMQKGERDRKVEERREKSNVLTPLESPTYAVKVGMLSWLARNQMLGRNKCFPFFCTMKSASLFHGSMHRLANQVPVKSELMKQVPKFSVWLSVGIEGNKKWIRSMFFIRETMNQFNCVSIFHQWSGSKEKQIPCIHAIFCYPACFYSKWGGRCHDLGAIPNHNFLYQIKTKICWISNVLKHGNKSNDT